MEKDSMSGKKSPSRGTPPSAINKQASTPSSASVSAARPSAGTRTSSESGSGTRPVSESGAGKPIDPISERAVSVSSPVKPEAANTAPFAKGVMSSNTETSATVGTTTSSKHEVKASAQSPMLRTPSSSASVKPVVDRSKPAESKNSASGEERNRLIAEAAYYIAEKRHFQGGDPAQDWIQAEQEVDSRLSSRR